MQVLAVVVGNTGLVPVVNRASRRWLHERIRMRLASELSAFQEVQSARDLYQPITRLLGAQQLGLLDLLDASYCARLIAPTLQKLDACRCSGTSECHKDLNNNVFKICWLVDLGFIERLALPIAAARLRELGLGYLCADGAQATSARATGAQATGAHPFHSNAFFHLLIDDNRLPAESLVPPLTGLLHAAMLRFSEATLITMCRCYARWCLPSADLRLLLLCFGYLDAASLFGADGVRLSGCGAVARLLRDHCPWLPALSPQQAALLLRWYAAELYNRLAFLRTPLFYAHVNNAPCCREALRRVWWQNLFLLSRDPAIVPP